jgi:hypothetical protein
MSSSPKDKPNKKTPELQPIESPAGVEPSSEA